MRTKLSVWKWKGLFLKTLYFIIDAFKIEYTINALSSAELFYLKGCKICQTFHIPNRNVSRARKALCCSSCRATLATTLLWRSLGVTWSMKQSYILETCIVTKYDKWIYWISDNNSLRWDEFHSLFYNTLDNSNLRPI